MTRLIDLPPSALPDLRGSALVDAIRGSEGRTVAAETIVAAGPLLDKVSDAELLTAAGADIVVMNLYDVDHPRVMGMPPADGHAEGSGLFGYAATGDGRTARDVAEWAGCVAAINLEPVAPEHTGFPQGRRASARNAARAAEQGVQLVVVTGNPGTGVTMRALAEATAAMREETGDDVVYLAGRIHAAGSGEPVVTRADVDLLADAGAHGIVMPAPGTTPGSSLTSVTALVEAAHERGLLAWNGIGTSQEGASTGVIERIALDSKSSGADVHHIGDSGFFGIAPPENVYAYSVALRGRRHTWFRMAASARR